MPGTVPVAFLFRFRFSISVRCPLPCRPVPSSPGSFGVADVPETSEMLAVLRQEEDEKKRRREEGAFVS